VITHGGPSTYMQVLQHGKIPIVVPRQEKFGEHINDHQLRVSKQVIKKGYPLILCEDVSALKFCIESSRIRTDEFIKSNNKNFISNFKKIIAFEE